MLGGFLFYASMVELVDTLVLGTSATAVPVRVRVEVPNGSMTELVYVRGSNPRLSEFESL